MRLVKAPDRDACEARAARFRQEGFGITQLIVKAEAALEKRRAAVKLAEEDLAELRRALSETKAALAREMLALREMA